MDFFFDDLPCSSESGQRQSHDEANMTEDFPNSFRGEPSTVNITAVQEQHTCSSIDDISRRVQVLVENINDSRNSDQKVMDSCQENLVLKVTEMSGQMKEHIYAVYEDNSNAMQVKLQELSEVMERCTKLIKELSDANQELASLRKALSISQEPEP